MPASANLTAVPKPMPLLAPVMIATCMSPLRFRICDAHIRRFQPAGNGDQDLRTLQQQMRVRFIAEADAAVNLDVLAGVGSEEQPSELQSLIRLSFAAS